LAADSGVLAGADQRAGSRRWWLRVLFWSLGVLAISGAATMGYFLTN